MPTKKKTHKRTVNTYYLLASASLAATAVFALPLGNSYLGYLLYISAALTLIFGLVGMVYKKKREPIDKAITIIQVTSSIYAVLGLLVLLVLISQLTGAFRVPLFSDFDYANYLQGWPVIEIALVGSVTNALYRLSHPSKWLAYSGGILMATSLILWLLTAHYGYITTP